MENAGIIDTSEYPLVILGAGASHDFVSVDSRVNMPVTDELIRKVDPNIARRYPHVEVLFSLIEPMVTHKKEVLRKTFEESLQGVTDHEQLSGLRFYLQEYFFQRSAGAEASNANINHYKALIEWIAKGKAKGAFVVSFNYDVLFELQLDLAKFVEMGDYVNSRIKIIKPHGSSDWFYITQKNPMQTSLGVNTAYEYLNRVTDFKPGPIHTDRILNKIQGSRDFWKIPALAIPTPDVKPFVCPDDHIAMLTEALKTTKKILIIGWRAGDRPLVDLMKNNLKNPALVHIVSGSAKGIETVKYNLREVPNLTFEEDENGFSSFLGGDGCRAFFQE